MRRLHLILQRSETSESSPSLFSGSRSGGVAVLMILKQVGQALGFTGSSMATQVLSAGKHQGLAHLFQSDLGIFPPGAASCAS